MSVFIHTANLLELDLPVRFCKLTKILRFTIHRFARLLIEILGNYGKFVWRLSQRAG